MGVTEDREKDSSLKMLKEGSLKHVAELRRQDEAIALALRHGAIQSDLDRALEDDITATDPGLAMALIFYRNASQQAAHRAEACDRLLEQALTLGASLEQTEEHTKTFVCASHVIPGIRASRVKTRLTLLFPPGQPFWKIALEVVTLIVVLALAAVVAYAMFAIVVVSALLGANRKMGNGRKTASQLFARDLIEGPEATRRRKQRRRR